MGVRKLKPTTPGQRHKVIGAFDKITASTPEKSLVVGKKSTGGVILVVAINVSTELSTSREIKMAFQQQLSQSNTIRIVLLALHCCIMQMEQRVILSLRMDWKLARQWFRGAMQLQRLVILCRWQIFPLVLLFIILSFVQGKEPSWSVLPARLLS